MLAIPKLNIDRTGINNMMFALMVVTAVAGMIFYFTKTDRMGEDFLASIFAGSQNEEVEEEISEEEEVVSLSEEYVEVAQAGDGLTHIARRALDRHLNDIGDEIGSERRVYVEDYIQKSLGGSPILLNEEISVSRDLIIEAIDASFELDSVQIENLESYSSLVTTFN